MNSRKVAELLLEIKAVALKPSDPYKYTSGILSPIYTDNRLLMGYPEKRKKIISAMKELIEKKGLEFNVIGATATAAIPHAAWLADQLNKPMVYVRSSKKEHGKKNKVEGLVKENWKAIVIEDLISTGGSSMGTVNGLRSTGVKVNDIIAIFTYQMEKSIERFREGEVELHALTDFSTMIEVAAEKGFITGKEKESALEWNKDPQNWGKKMGFE